jgi:hypothetical protein
MIFKLLQDFLDIFFVHPQVWLIAARVERQDGPVTMVEAMLDTHSTGW